QGQDRGRGGTYVLLPPDDRGSDVADAIAVPMQTYNGYIALRAIPEDGSDAAIARALELVRELRVYPASRGVPPQQRFIDMTGKLFDGIVQFDDHFFDHVAPILGEEPVLPRDIEAISRLATLGVIRGIPPRVRPAMPIPFAAAARAAHAGYMRGAHDDGAIYWRGRRWRTPSAIGVRTGWTFVTDDGLDARARGLTYFLACAPAAKLGKASFYLLAFADASGSTLAGEHAYRLRVPAQVPASQFWAATVYDASTAA